MPFYEYECSNCKFYSEVMQKITDAPLKKCPSCGKSTLKKLVSIPNFRLKGAGWYETDFKSEKEAKRNLAEAERSETKEGEAKESKAETTEAKAPEAKPAETKSEPKAAAAASSGRKSVALSRKSSSHRTAKARGSRPAGRTKARPRRKGRR
jgi:putative FmdB family regulatory protein